MSSERYEHSQFGILTVVILLLVSALVAIIFWMNSGQAGPRIAMSITVVFLVLVLLLFYRLKVVVDSGQLAIRFGIGLIRFHYPLMDIVSAKVVRNKWYWGVGIRYYGCNGSGQSCPDSEDPENTWGNSGPSFITEYFEGHGGSVLPTYLFIGRVFLPVSS